jgi:hypothetical protein
MEQVHEVLQAFAAATELSGRKCGIAAFKRALLGLGVVRSAAVAPGTPELSADEAARFDDAFAVVRELAAARIGEPWVSVAPAAQGGAGG